MIKIYILTILLGLSVSPTFSNQYDDDEKIKRWAENEDRKEQAERDAAKQRYDDTYGPKSQGSGGAFILFLGAFGVGAWIYFKQKSN